MLTVVSGPFEGLEEAFIKRIAELKKDPLAKLAIVAPSSRLVDRLQLALAGRGKSYLNLHFHTFSSLAELIVDSEASLEKPVLSDPLFFDTLVKQIVREDKPFDVFEELAVPEGFPPAVRGTLRDLLDAGINQDNVDDLIQEGFAGTDVDLGSLRSLLNLHRLYMRRVGKLSVFPRSELLGQAIKLTPDSKVLKEFDEILYYGFYDLTGLQSDFFQVVVKNFPSQFFFPYVHNHPAYGFAKRFRDVFVQPVMREEIVCAPKVEKPLIPSILNVSGQRDEAWFVANEIRRLHDEQKVAFSEMAVVARTRDRLGFLIQEALSDRGIPYRPSVHPNLGMFPDAQLALRVLAAHEAEESSLTWENAIKKAEELLPLASPKMMEGIRSLSSFKEIDETIAWMNFVDIVRDRWSRTEVRDESSNDVGVALLYAEAARGLPFKAVFLIGLEEKVFPRIVREDPFLRDDAREALNGIGHKISKKMSALEEERLLFELLITAATHHLYLIHQRSDDEGGVVGTSSFLRSFAEEHGLSLDKLDVSLPRPLMAKIKEANPSILGVSDIVIGFLAAHKELEALQLAESIGRDKANLARGLQLQKAISSFSHPGLYDALIGKMETANIFRKGKISATALETYAQCGYRYFASRILGLAPLEVDEAEDALAADIRGKLVHSFIEIFFRKLTKEGTVPPPPHLPKDLYDSLFDEIVTVQVPSETRIPAVLWQATRASLRIILAAFLENELQLLHAEGMSPTYFEAAVEGTLPPPLDGYVWTGVLDRIDMKGTSAEVLDYKTGRPFKTKTVSTLAKNGEKMQAPLYLLMAEKFLEKMGRKATELSFRYEFVDHLSESRVMDAAEWALHSKVIQSTVRTLVDAAHQGNFIMKPGWYCDYCDVARACRKNHGISVYRSEQAVPK